MQPRSAPRSVNLAPPRPTPAALVSRWGPRSAPRPSRPAPPARSQRPFPGGYRLGPYPVMFGRAHRNSYRLSPLPGARTWAPATDSLFSRTTPEGLKRRSARIAHIGAVRPSRRINGPWDTYRAPAARCRAAGHADLAHCSGRPLRRMSSSMPASASIITSRSSRSRAVASAVTRS